MRVVDSSFVLALLTEPDAVVDVVPHDAWIAPQLLGAEFVSGLRGLILGGRLDPLAAEIALQDYADLGIRTWPIDVSLRRRVLQLRHNLTAYDASYIALAEALEVPLVTRDARMARGAPPGVRVDVV